MRAAGAAELPDRTEERSMKTCNARVTRVQPRTTTYRGTTCNPLYRGGCTPHVTRRFTPSVTRALHATPSTGAAGPTTSSSAVCVYFKA